MYGKSFIRMYQGSMVGAGSHVFAVWGYCISCADPEEHTVELNPTLLATIIGDSEERVKTAIDFLCAPDPKSHCTLHNGARLLHQGGYQYFLVTHEQYRNIKNSEELRAYFREKKRESRMSKTVKDSLGKSQDSASVSVSPSESLFLERGKGETILGEHESQRKAVEIWLSELYHRKPTTPWTGEEMHLLVDVSKRPDIISEIDELNQHWKQCQERKYLPQSVTACLRNWGKMVDAARVQKSKENLNGNRPKFK